MDQAICVQLLLTWYDFGSTGWRNSSSDYEDILCHCTTTVTGQGFLVGTLHVLCLQPGQEQRQHGAEEG